MRGVGFHSVRVRWTSFVKFQIFCVNNNDLCSSYETIKRNSVLSIGFTNCDKTERDHYAHSNGSVRGLVKKSDTL
jgi:hypothetical protein